MLTVRSEHGDAASEQSRGKRLRKESARGKRSPIRGDDIRNSDATDQTTMAAEVRLTPRTETAPTYARDFAVFKTSDAKATATADSETDEIDSVGFDDARVFDPDQFRESASGPGSSYSGLTRAVFITLLAMVVIVLVVILVITMQPRSLPMLPSTQTPTIYLPS